MMIKATSRYEEYFEECNITMNIELLNNVTKNDIFSNNIIYKPKT